MSFLWPPQVTVEAKCFVRPMSWTPQIQDRLKTHDLGAPQETENSHSWELTASNKINSDRQWSPVRLPIPIPNPKELWSR